MRHTYGCAMQSGKLERRSLLRTTKTPIANTVASFISQEPGNSLPDSSRFGGCWRVAATTQRLPTAFASTIGCSGKYAPLGKRHALVRELVPRNVVYGSDSRAPSRTLSNIVGRHFEHFLAVRHRALTHFAVPPGCSTARWGGWLSTRQSHRSPRPGQRIQRTRRYSMISHRSGNFRVNLR
jgi:hypothetical protein